MIWWLYAQDVPGASYAAAWVVLFAALSDIADGILARRLEAQSEFGRWVDPVVDRVFFFALLAMLWYYDTLPLWAVVPLLLRDGMMLLLAIPVRKYTDQGPQVSRWGRGANLALICAIQWFIIDLSGIGWAFYAVGATLYLGVGAPLPGARRRHPAPHEGRVARPSCAGRDARPAEALFRPPSFQVRCSQPSPAWGRRG